MDPNGGLDGLVHSPVLSASDVRPAASGAPYTCLCLTWGEAQWAAVPIAARAGGLLVALPAAAIPEEDRVAAADGDFAGILGPSILTTCALRGAAGRALRTSADIAVVDLAILQGEEGLLHYLEEGDIDSVSGFATLRGSSLWLATRAAAALLPAWVAALEGDGQPEGLAARYGEYVTASEGDAVGAVTEPVLPVSRPAGGSASGRSAASPAAVLRGADGGQDVPLLQRLLERLDSQQAAGPTSSPTGAEPLFAEEAARVGLGRDQIVELLRAVGTPPPSLAGEGRNGRGDLRDPPPGGAGAPCKTASPCGP